jgi:hypothetical protein
MDVTYIALPFVMADNGVAPGEAVSAQAQTRASCAQVKEARLARQSARVGAGFSAPKSANGGGTMSSAARSVRADISGSPGQLPAHSGVPK